MRLYVLLKYQQPGRTQDAFKNDVIRLTFFSEKTTVIGSLDMGIQDRFFRHFKQFCICCLAHLSTRCCYVYGTTMLHTVISAYCWTKS